MSGAVPADLRGLPGPPKLVRALSHASEGVAREVREALAKDIKQGIPGTSQGGADAYVGPVVRTMSRYSFALPAPARLSGEYRDFIRRELVQADHDRELARLGVLGHYQASAGSAGLVPMKTEGDGNCLLHSVALGMWGIHDRDLALRRALKNTLKHPSLLSAFRKRWAAESQPAGASGRSSPGGPSSSDPPRLVELRRQTTLTPAANRWGKVKFEFLEQLHIFALAHVLRRPVVCYADNSLRDHTGSVFCKMAPSEAMLGIYMPLLIPPSECVREPLAITFESSHFAALVPARGEGSDREGSDREGSDREGSDREGASAQCEFPLFTREGEPIPVRFMLPEEAKNTHALLRAYLNLKPSQDSKRPVAIQTALTLPAVNKDYINRYMDYCKRRKARDEALEKAIKKGDRCLYKGSQFVSVARVHYDVEDGLYYTVRRADGVEVQTIPRYLELPKPSRFVALPRAPAGRTGHVACVWRGGLYVFGGQSADEKAQSDIFRFSIHDQKWTKVQPQSPPRRADGESEAGAGAGGESPPEARPNAAPKATPPPAPRARFGHSALVYGHHMYVYGGDAGGGGEVLDDLWRFNFKSQVWEAIPARGAKPIARVRHSASLVYGGAGGQRPLMVIFGGWAGDLKNGGSSPEDAFAQPQAFDLASLEWLPPARTRGAVSRIWHSAVVSRNKSSQTVYVFAGEDNKTFLQEQLYAIDGGFDKMEVVSGTSGSAPAARYGHAAAIVASPAVGSDGKRGEVQSMIVFGGYSGNGAVSGDLYQYSFDAKRWRRVDATSRAPAARFGHSLSRDPETGRVFLFGGKTAMFETLHDFYELEINGDMAWATTQPQSSASNAGGSAGGGSGSGSGGSGGSARSYDNECAQLAAMGFADRPAVLAALRKSNGDVNNAVQLILSGSVGNSTGSGGASEREDRYAAQRSQLEAMGFSGRAKLDSALERAGGSVERALNFLMSG